MKLTKNPLLFRISLLSAAILSLCTLSQAAIIRVSPGNPSGDGTSWSSPANLRWALANASTGDEIWIKQGKYFPDEGTGATNDNTSMVFNVTSGVALYGGFSGSETSRNARNVSSNVTILSGDIDQTDAYTNIRISIDDNGTPGDPSDDITRSVYEGVPNIITDPTTIHGDNANNILRVHNVSSQTVTLDGLTFTAGDSSFGGAAVNAINSRLVINNCRFVGNRSQVVGGAISLQNSWITMSDCIVESNTAGVYGGGLYYSITQLTGSNSTLQSSSSRFNRCQFSGNWVEHNTNNPDNYANSVLGGAVMFQSTVGNFGAVPTQDTWPVFNSCIFTGNHSERQGAAAGTVEIPVTYANCNFIANRAVNGATFFSQSYNYFVNTIMWGNVNDSGGEIAYSLSGGTLTFDNCLIEGLNDNELNGSNNLAGRNSSNAPDFTDVNLDAANTPMTDFGDFRIPRDSHLINAGSTPSWGLGSKDFYGVNRIVNGTPDIGAAEGNTHLYADEVGRIGYINRRNQEIEDAINLLEAYGNLITANDVKSITILSNSNTDVVTSVIIDTDEKLNVGGSNTFVKTGFLNVRLGSEFGTANVVIQVNTDDGFGLYEVNVYSSSTNIYVNPGATGTGSGDSWANAYTNLSDALDATVPGNSYPNQTVWVAQGTYKVTEFDTFELRDGVRLVGGFNSDGSATSLSDSDPDAYLSKISGDGPGDSGETVAGSNDARNIFTTIDGVTASIAGFTIIGANGRGGAKGGGLYIANESDDITVTDCKFSFNRSTGGGGGAYVAPNATARFYNCEFSDGFGHGAGIYADEGSNLTVKNCLFEDSNDSGNWQSTVLLGENSISTFLNVLFRGNRGTITGGVHAEAGSQSSFTNVAFSGNLGENSAGAFANFGTATFTNCTFSGNQGGDSGSARGGAFANGTGGSATWNNSIVWNNSYAGSTTDQDSSIGNPGSSFSYCLIENFTTSDLGGTGNLDGTIASNDPSFQTEPNPVSAPTSYGNLQLGDTSAAIDAGSDALNTELLDLAGEVRSIGGGIDMGAYENATGVSASSNNDSGDGSLRAAIAAAPDGGVISLNFALNGATITLSSPLEINKNITIDASHLPNGLTLSGNNATRIINITGGPTVRFVGLVFADGSTPQSQGATGAAIFAHSGSNLTLIDCEFVGNVARYSVTGNGGALRMNASTFSIERCLFHNNDAEFSGGAVACFSSNGTVRDSVFAGNRADAGGAWAFGISDTSNVTFTNCTLQGNHAELGGGGVFAHQGSSVQLTFRNSIIWDNSGQNTVTEDESYFFYLAPLATINFFNSLVEHFDLSGSNGNFDGTTTPSALFADSISPSAAPSLAGALQLLGSSPLVDAGNNSYVASAFTATDLSGNPRISGNAVDVGAYESGQQSLSDELLLIVDDGTAEDALDLGSLLGLSSVSGAELISNDNSALIQPTVGADGLVDLSYSLPTADGDANLVFYAVGPASSGYYSVKVLLRQDSVLRVNDDATGTADGYSWANAYPNLQDALAIAEIGQEIWVAAGTYYPDVSSAGDSDDRNASFELIAGVNVYGGFAGNETTRGTRALLENVTILSGDIDQDDVANTPDDGNSYQIVIFNAGIDESVTLEGFTIMGGNANGADPLNSAPAVYLPSGILSINSCVIADNVADRSGAIFVVSQGTLQASNSILTRNTSGFRGGAIHIASGTNNSWLSNLTIVDNTSILGGGVAIVNLDLGVYNCIIWDNTAVHGSNAQGQFLAVSTTGVTYINSLIEGHNLSGSNNNLDGTGGVNNPRFFSSTDLRLLNSSPAIDAGDNSYASGLDVSGNPRIFNSVADLGAYEMIYEEPTELNHVAAVDLTETGVLDLNTIFSAGASNFALHFNSASAFLNVTVNADGTVDFTTTGDSTPGDYEITFIANEGTATIFHQINLKIVPVTIYVNGSISGGNHDGSSWDNAYASLSDALDNYRTGNEAIWVAAGTYYPSDSNDPTAVFAVKDGVEIYGGFAGTETTFDERDVEINVTILSGDIDQNDGDFPGTSNSDTIMHLADGAENVIVDGLTFTRAFAEGSTTGLDSRGGAIFATNANFIVSNCRFERSTTVAGGAGIYVEDSTLEVSDSHFERNQGRALAYLNADITLSRCVFYLNSVSGSGGALGSVSESNASTASTVEAVNCQFLANSSHLFGGVALTDEGDILSFTNCLFAANSGYLIGISEAQAVTITNCTFANNLNRPVHSIDEIAGSTLTINNTIVWDNDENDIFIGNPTNLTVTYNNTLIEGVDLTGVGTGNLDGTDAANAPSFLNLIDPHTVSVLEGDYRIGIDSPLIGLADPALNTSEFDLEGKDRHINELDLGAYESTLARFFVKANVSGGTQKGYSWTNAYPTLQDALTRAHYGDTIWVAGGTYYPDETRDSDTDDTSSKFILIDGVALYGGFVGHETSLAQRGNGTSVLSGDIDQDGTTTGNAGKIVQANGLSADTIFDKFTITGATGRGMTISGGAPAFANLRINYNNGGGVSASGSDFTLTNSLIHHNSTGGNGAGMSVSTGNPVITGCDFYWNTAGDNALGGGFYFGHRYDGDDNQATVVNCSFRGNYAGLGGGAALYYRPSKFYNCVFSGNRATDIGGGVYLLYAGGFTFVNCTITANLAYTSAGGWWNSYSYGGSWKNMLIWGNNATRIGGGELENARNNNIGQTNPKNCLIQYMTLEGDQGFDGNDANNTPSFVNLPNPGRKTGGNYRLNYGSFGVNAGDDQYNGYATDRDGNIRISGSAIDIGAYERDSNVPVITLNGENPMVLEVGSIYSEPGATATDDINGNLTNSIAIDASSVNTAVLGSYSVTYDVNDNSQNPAVQVVRTVNVEDTTAPVVTAPANVIVECTGPTGTVVAIGTPTVSDFDSSPTVSDNAPASYPLGTTTVTWTATDASGNMGTANQTVTVVDTTAPTVTAGADITVEATSVTGETIDIGTATVSDICDTNPSLNHDAPTLYTIGTTTVTWTATDASNNVGTDIQLITVQDTTAPVIELGGDAVVAIELNGSYTEAGATVTDIFAAPLVIGGDTVDTTTDGTYIITYDATDANGNAATQLIRRVEVGVANRYYVDANAADGGDGLSWGTAFNKINDALDKTFAGLGQEVWVAAGVYYPDEGEFQTDNDRNSTFTLRDSVSLYGGFAGGETSVDQRDPATNVTILHGDLDQNDASGHSDDNSQFHRDLTGSNAYTLVFGETGATNIVLDGFTLTAANANGLVDEFFIATDETGRGGAFYGDQVELTINQCIIERNYAHGLAGGIMLLNSTLTMTHSSVVRNGGTNGAGISLDTCTITIENSHIDDNYTPGVAAGLASFGDCVGEFVNTTFSGNFAGFYGGVMLVGNDDFTFTNCVFSGNRSISTALIDIAGLSRLIFNNCTFVGNRANNMMGSNNGAITSVQEMVFSNCIMRNNSDLGFFTSTIRSQDVTANDTQLDGSTDPLFIESIAFTDAPTTAGDFRLQSGSPFINAGDDALNSEATDLDGNVRIQGSSIDRGAYEFDEEAPVITLLGDNPLTLEVGVDTYAEPGATASDAAEGDLTASIVTDSSAVNTATTGSYNVTYNVSDSSGNAAVEVTRVVNVVDTTKPTITAPANITGVECTSPTGQAVALGSATVSDSYDATPIVTNDAPALFTLGTTVVTWTATDSSGNQATATQNVTLVDTLAPVISEPADITVEATSNSGQVVALGTATALDQCDLSPTLSDDAPSVFPLGETTVTYTATDSSGNQSQATQTVTVEDTIAPVLTLNGAATIELSLHDSYNELGATVTDLFPTTVQVAGNTVDTSTVGIYTVTYNTTDTSGNAATQITRTVIVNGNAYQVWINKYYPGETDDTVMGAGVDPKRLGYANAVAFLTASSPLVYDVNTQPQLVRSDSILTYHFSRSDRAAEFNPVVEYSTNLVDWEVVDAVEGVTVTTIDDGFGTDGDGVGIDRVTVEVDTTIAPGYFFRQSIVIPE